VSAPGSAPAGAGERASRTAWIALAALTGINLLNYFDRYVVPAIQEQLRASPMHPSDEQLGALTSAFFYAYMVFSPIFGAYGNRGNRPRLLAAGVAVWSVATALGGFASSYGQLLSSRAVVGIGEAIYATIGPALLADYFPASMRGRVMAIFYAAMPVGAAAGLGLSGAIAVRYGWPHAFFVAGIPGIALAVGLLFVPEAKDRAAGESTVGVRGYLTLARNLPYVIIVLGLSAYTFGVGGTAAWLPSWLQRERGLSTQAAAIVTGAAIALAGGLGSIVGGWLGDRLLPRWRESYLWVSAVSTLVAAPLAWFAFTGPAPAYLVATFLAVFFLFFSILSVVPAGLRAAAMALSILVIHALGDAPAPKIIGRISDTSSLGHAMLIVPVAILLGGLIWLYAAWRGERAPRPAEGATM